jgi:cytochrome P450
LINLVREGKPLDDEDVLDVMSLFFFAGTDSSTGAMAYAMLRLATHPADRGPFIAGSSDQAAIVEELLRLGAVHYIARRLVEDVELDGVTMKAGDYVALPTLAANRDSAVYKYPDDLDPHREAPAHLTFGLGRHRCLGLHQARAEMRFALEEFHAAIPNYELDRNVTLDYITGVRSRPTAVPLRIVSAPS